MSQVFITSLILNTSLPWCIAARNLLWHFRLPHFLDLPYIPQIMPPQTFFLLLLMLFLGKYIVLLRHVMKMSTLTFSDVWISCFYICLKSPRLLVRYGRYFRGLYVIYWVQSKIAGQTVQRFFCFLKFANNGVLYVVGLFALSCITCVLWKCIYICKVK